MANTIEVKDLYFSYELGNPVIQGASFSISAGSYTTIIGHNGSGKSTLAKLLAGLLEKESGSIQIQGKEMSAESLDEIRSQIGIVFQNPDNQFIGSTVRDDIAFGLENHQVEPAKMDAIIEDNAQRVGMFSFLDKEPSHLSGGQKQRVAIAGVLAMSPDVLILDEATSMLDPMGKYSINQLIKQLYKKEGLTILSITHDMNEVLQSTNVIALADGRPIYTGDPMPLFHQPDLLKKLQVEVPFVVEVEARLKKKGISVDATKGIEGMVDELWQFISKK
ncbi:MULTISPECIES: energy-coupling factor transporter ATPase [Terrabacteria group]|uniref:energy-coupling factor transporter ATPase n=1 Tax=Bacillati TaxID=1783272 RepID=UPI001C6EBBD0|nr:MULTISPECIES: energy-coupling factor transporter ATPase [Terrabacteria group]MBW9212642.1 energy-coupling factor transporter ATPase [Trueperella sp. zg.1013]